MLNFGSGDDNKLYYHNQYINWSVKKDKITLLYFVLKEEIPPAVLHDLSLFI